MAVRMERQAYNADRLARYLASHPLVERVNYPGLATHRGHAVHMRQASVGGCLLSFTTGSLQASKVTKLPGAAVGACCCTSAAHSCCVWDTCVHACGRVAPPMHPSCVP